MLERGGEKKENMWVGKEELKLVCVREKRKIKYKDLREGERKRKCLREKERTKLGLYVREKKEDKIFECEREREKERKYVS